MDNKQRTAPKAAGSGANRERTPMRGPRSPHGGMHFEKPKDAKGTLVRLMGYLHHKRFALGLVFLLMLLNTGSMLAGNYFLKPLINDYILPGNFSGLAIALMTLGVIYLVGVIAAYFQNRTMVYISQETTNLMRRELFAHMQKLPLKYFDARTHGDLMSRFTNDIDNVQMALQQSLIQLISSSLTFVGAVILMLVLSPILFVVVLFMMVLMFFLSGKIASRSSKFFKAQQEHLGDLNGYIEEMVDGLKVVKVFTHEDEAIGEFKQRNEKYRQSATQANFISSMVMPIMGNLNNINYAITAMAGGVLAVMTPFDIGSLAAFLQFSRQIGFPVQQITSQLNVLLAAVAGAERVFAVLDEVPEKDHGQVRLVGVNKLTDGRLEVCGNGTHPCHWAWKVPQADGSFQLVELQGDVRFHDVTFGYDPEKTVLHDLSLFAKPGQKIAFVGSTGAGKTTITNLFNRFYEIDQGRITYDGVDVQDIRKEDLRASLGMVLQDTHLFSGTIMENIRYGRLDASDEECIQAAVQVNAHSFIKRLPDGYKTVITADGTNLSQGQRQLLAIARAAVADPPVMILDEATSSIDTRTERLIEKGMDALMKDRTVFVIAHRLSTVRNADAILVLEDGRIIERGDHAGLLDQQGRYYQLYTGQYQLT